MSWLRQVGGSLSSMTGQLSTLTKDILTEGAEESEDHEAELKLAKTKIRELEALVATNRSEIDRLQTVNANLEMKSKTAEFQMQSLYEAHKEQMASREMQRVWRERGEPEGGPSSAQQQFGSHYGVKSRRHLDSDGYADANDNHDDDFASEEGAIFTAPGSTPGPESSPTGRVNGSETEAEAETLREQLRLQDEARRQELAALQEAHSHQLAALKRQMSDLERRLPSADLLDALDSALAKCKAEEIEALLRSAQEGCLRKDELLEAERNARAKAEEGRLQLEQEVERLRRSLSDLEEERQQSLQGGPSTSFLETLGSEALSQVSDLSNVSVRSRQLEDSIRHLAGQIEAFEAQLGDQSHAEGGGGGGGGEGGGGEKEHREAEALQQRLIKKKEAMELLRARKAQLRRDRRHARRRPVNGIAEAGEMSLPSVEEIAGKEKSPEVAASPDNALPTALSSALSVLALPSPSCPLAAVTVLSEAVQNVRAERDRLAQRLAGARAEQEAYSRGAMRELEALKAENERLVGEQLRAQDLANEACAPGAASMTDLRGVLVALQLDKEGLASQVAELRAELTAAAAARREVALAQSRLSSLVAPSTSSAASVEALCTQVEAEVWRLREGSENDSGATEEDVAALRLELADREAALGSLDEENGELRRLALRMKEEAAAWRHKAEAAAPKEAEMVALVARHQSDLAAFQAECDGWRERAQRLEKERDEERLLKASNDPGLEAECQRLATLEQSLMAERENLMREQQNLIAEREKLMQEQRNFLTDLENFKLEQQNFMAAQDRMSQEQQSVMTERENLEKDQQNFQIEREKLEKEQQNFQIEREKLEKEQQNVQTERENLEKDQQSIMTEHENLKKEQQTERENLIKDQQIFMTERSKLVVEQQNLMTEREKLSLEQQNILTELEKLTAEQQNLKAEREQLSREKQTFMTEREHFVTEHRKQLEANAESSPADADTALSALRLRLHQEQEERQRLTDEVASLSRRCSELQGEAEQLRPLAESGHGGGHSGGAEVEAMGRKAIHHLSQLVRDKEAEIEALRSRNASLLQVLQSTESGGTAVADVGAMQRIMAEKEALEARLRAFHQDREQLVAALSQKHSESVGYHAEIQRLVALMQTERPKWMAAQEEVQTLRKELTEASAGKRHSEEALAALRASYNELRVAHKAAEELQMATPAASPEDGPSEVERTLRQQLERLTFESSESQIRQSDLEAEVTSLRRQLGDAHLEIDCLRQQNQTLQQGEWKVQPPEAQEAQQPQKPQEDIDPALRNLAELQRERDQLAMALQAKQSDASRLKQEYQTMCDKEGRLQGELQRLREHLVQVEESYTSDVLVAEEREKTLRDRLTAAEQRLMITDSAVQSASREAAHKVEDAAKDLLRLRSERDAALTELSAAQEELHQQMQSVNNLQMVLEQFQREKDTLVAMETEHYLKQIAQTKTEMASLKNALLEAEQQLKEQSDAIEAARRISEEAEKKEHRILELEEDMQRRNADINSMQKELEKMATTAENKIDKLLMKNLLISYFNTPSSKRRDALRVIAGLLQCSPEELPRLGLEAEGGGWFGRWRAAVRPRTGETGSPEHSFTEQFVRFLERESKPQQIFQLPTDQLVAEVQKQRPAGAVSPPPPPPPPPPSQPPPSTSAPVPAAAPVEVLPALVLPQSPAPLPVMTSSPARRMDSRNALLSLLSSPPS